MKIDYVSPRPEACTAKPTNNINSIHSRPGFSLTNVNMANDPNKQKSTVSEEQRHILLRVFNGNHHPDRDTQMGLAVELGLPVSIISNFFLNARRRLRYSYNRGGVNSSAIKRV